jgi:hypothetical protein
MASSGRSYQALQTVVFALRGHGVPKPVEARNATPRAKQRKPVQPIGPAKRVAPTAASAPPGTATEEK